LTDRPRPQGQLIFNFFASLSEFERDLIREDVRFLSLRHPLAEQAINREGPGAPDQDGYSQADRQQMVLKSLPFLLTKPVHVKAKVSEHHQWRPFAILCNEVDSAVAGVALLAIRDRIS